MVVEPDEPADEFMVRDVWLPRVTEHSFHRQTHPWSPPVTLPAPQGDAASQAPSDEAREKSRELVGKGRSALGQGDFPLALSELTEAIRQDSTSARPFSFRAKGKGLAGRVVGDAACSAPHRMVDL